ncbi:HK97 gp10 family phage protein [Enterobacter sp. Ap-916]|uniref:HK97 gp10 family phage protein n=1 Tax=unclassified Enterobacter TaxID=2608935 RepID=UPI00141ECA24|nr:MULTISPECIES: HK97 gp10 family phage protein [unclassified Enterobacter]NIF57536.1 HK97 gp10 family phage protein [Enterobacter sp. Ap-867]NIG28521.1 HK97 gp10 family phage protein [Enterobacter sp. Ap-916]
MVVKVKGVSQAKQKLDALLGEVQGRKVGRAIKSALFIIGADAATMTPIDTSYLVNSQYQEMLVNGTRVTGRVGYSANYAVYVHEASGKLRGRPRANGSGNYWDPSGEPKFLEKAFKDNADKVAAIIHKELSL